MHTQKSYFNGQESVRTLKYDTNGLVTEIDDEDSHIKYEYNDNFQKTKRVFVDKKDASKNSITVSEYNSNGHLIRSTKSTPLKITSLGSIHPPEESTYTYELDAQKNWTKQVLERVSYEVKESSVGTDSTKDLLIKGRATSTRIRVITYY